MKNCIYNTGERPYKCRLCKYKSGYRSALYRHILRKHPDARSCKCTVCGRAFVTQTQLRSHLRRHTGEHSRIRLSSDPKIRPSQYQANNLNLSQAIVTQTQLRSHLRRHTGGSSSQDIVDKPYKCTICKFSSEYKDSLASHIGTHTGEKPYKCGLCEYETRYRSALYRHIWNKHPDTKPFQCTVCGQSFVKQTQLRWHLRHHTDEHHNMYLSSHPKPCVGYRCTLCKYSSKHKGNMAKHIRIHTGVKPYECRLCEYSSSDASSLYGHMDAKHPGIKPYKCTVCGEAFLRISQLERHLDLHV